MPIKSKYLFVVSMDVDPDKEALFNEVYDSEHVPNLLQVPGVHAVARMVGEPFVLNIGGQDDRKNIWGLIDGFAGLPARLRESHQSPHW